MKRVKMNSWRSITRCTADVLIDFTTIRLTYRNAAERLFCGIFIACLFCSSAWADSAPAGIASAHPDATNAGFEILEQGGNAFDAAIAVAATLAVVEPTGSGLGGGGFWLLHRDSDGKQVTVDGRERAPAASTADMYQDENGEPIPRASL